MALYPLSSWNKTIPIGALLIIWLVWGMSYLRPDVTQDVLSSLPSIGLGGSKGSGIANTSITSISGTTTGNSGDDLRPLVLYTYAESPNARANFEFFVRNGLHGRADFIFIFNGETDAADLLPAEPNIRVVHRENKCFDIGAHGEVLRQDDLWKKYKRFITMNASIRGPFAPMYYPSCWMDAFLGKITDKVKVSGGLFPHSPPPQGCLLGSLETRLVHTY